MGLADDLERLQSLRAAGTLNEADVTAELLDTMLDTAGIPDPDLIIRTSGEQRLSNFLLWQAAYSELLFLPCYWPDFSGTHLDQAIEAFSARERRFGGVLANDVAL